MKIRPQLISVIALTSRQTDKQQTAMNTAPAAASGVGEYQRLPRCP